MAWNEPGQGKDPWKGKRGEQPPDLDEVVRNIQKQFRSLFGGSGRRRGDDAGGGFSATLLIMIILGAWGASGLYKVDAAERGVVLRFGEHVHTTMPGLHWHIPFPVERVERVNVSEISRFLHQTRMLTSDENIVAVDVVVQYRKANPEDYLFRVRDPDTTLREVSESAIREVVGKSRLDFILGEGRAAIAQRTEDLVQETLDSYGTGIQITKVNLQDANFPPQVGDAVQDAIKAREDKERLSLQAQAYSNDILPRARGEAARRKQDADAYLARVIADAQGEASRFEQLLLEYEKAPTVTRERLYLETLEDVMSRSSKVVLDADGSGNLLYLPIDKLMEQGASGARSSTGPRGSNSPATAAAEDSRRERVELRTRGNR